MKRKQELELRKIQEKTIEKIESIKVLEALTKATEVVDQKTIQNKKEIEKIKESVKDVAKVVINIDGRLKNIESKMNQLGSNDEFTK